MVLMVMLFVMCLVRNQISSRDVHYAMDTMQYDYVTLEEVDEDIQAAASNWRGLQEKDVSFVIISSLRSLFYKGNLVTLG